MSLYANGELLWWGVDIGLILRKKKEKDKRICKSLMAASAYITHSYLGLNVIKWYHIKYN